MNSIAKPGSVLKRLRLANGWTLSDVSGRTGLPISTLSKIENDKMSLSYDKLARISRGLEIDIGLLFASETAAPPLSLVIGRRSVARAGEGSVIETEHYKHVYPATDLLNKCFVPIIAEIRARSVSEFSELIRHSGEEYAYVIEGTVELHTEMYAPVRLEVGDSIYFDSGMGHVYLAVGRGPCRVLAICSGEESQLTAAFASGASTRRLEPEEPVAKPVKAPARRRAGRS